MGYNTRVTGEITFAPPLTWSEIKADKFNLQGHYAVMINPRRDVTDTDTSQETVITADRLLPSWEEKSRYDELVEHVQKFIDVYGFGRTFTGYFDCVGEEQPDMWRVVIRDGTATVVRAVVLWPEDVTDLAEAVATAVLAQNADALVEVVMSAQELLTKLRKQFTGKDR